MNYKKIGKKIADKRILLGITQEELAEYLGITNSTLSFKINGKNDFLRAEIQLIKQRYKLTPQEIDQIFFS